MKCKTCQDTGECVGCGQSGKCSACDGEGWTVAECGHCYSTYEEDCDDCDTSGVCAMCDGECRCPDCPAEGEDEEDV